MGNRGPKPRGWKTYQQRYAENLREPFNRIYAIWQIDPKRVTEKLKQFCDELENNTKPQ